MAKCIKVGKLKGTKGVDKLDKYDKFKKLETDDNDLKVLDGVSRFESSKNGLVKFK